MKKLITALLLGMALVGAAPSPAGAEAAPAILLDGLPLGFPVPPMIVQDRTMVPFRAIAESLGVAVTWNGETRSITARDREGEVLLTIDQTVAWVSGIPVKLDVPPMILNDRTLVPLRFFSEAFGARVGWDGATRTVTIASPVRPMRTLAFYAIRSFGERQLVSQFSDAAYGWSVLKPDGRLDLSSDPDYRWPEPAGDISGESLLAEAKRFGTKRHLMVHALDSKGEFTRLVLDGALRQKAAAEIAAVVKARGFDGVVLDLEYLGQTELGADLERVRQGFASLVKALAGEMRTAGKETIVSVHPLNGAFHGYDYRALAEHADLLQLMAHDYLARPGDAGEPADLVAGAIELALAEVGSEKLLLGIVASYETPETLAQKAGLAKRYGLKGLSVWRLGTVGEERLQALESTVRPQK